MEVIIQDYEAGQETEVQDATDPYDHLPKELVNEIAATLVAAQEALQDDVEEIDIEEFYMRRGSALDRLEAGYVYEWLRRMQLSGRAPFKRHFVEEDDDAEEETGQRESASAGAENAV